MESSDRRAALRIHGAVSLAFCIGLVLSAGACDHDPTILETHPLDLTGATSASFESFHLAMSDGVRIALDVAVPNDHPTGGPLPTILEMTRYWRRRGSDLPFTVKKALQRGFVWVTMDERGTGASFGGWPAPLTDRALQDAGEVMDWIVQQPWSNGKVGASGVSYPGMAAHQLATLGHPALKAIVPMSDTWDQYQDLIFPGGVFNQGFLESWSEILHTMDRNSFIIIEGELFRLPPVDDDKSETLLKEALAGHAGNLDAYAAFQGISSRDDPGLSGLTLDESSTHTRSGELNASGIAIYHWGSWLDAGSADGVIDAFMSSTGPRRGVIGSWTHDLSANAFAGTDNRWEPVPSFQAQWEEALNFFDDILRKEKPLQDRVLRYYTMGEGLWKSTPTWPVPGTSIETLFLGEDGALTHSTPERPEGEDLYEVDFEVESSATPRWLGPLFSNTWYPDRTERDQALLTYQTGPLGADLEVTGHPVVHLNLSSTHSDGAFFVYLEDVNPQGVVTYVTEGILRGIHRKVTAKGASWRGSLPHHSYLAADIEPMAPGEVVELAISLQPTSFLFRKDHRVRIAIAGHDASSFRRIPATGTPLLKVQRNLTHPSRIELPVVR